MKRLPILLALIALSDIAVPAAEPSRVWPPALPSPRRLPVPDRPGCVRLEPHAWAVHSGDRLHLYTPVGAVTAGDVYLEATAGPFRAPPSSAFEDARARAATARLEALLSDAPAVWIEPAGTIRAGRPLARAWIAVDVAVPTCGGIVRYAQRTENVADRLLAEGLGSRGEASASSP